MSGPEPTSRTPRVRRADRPTWTGLSDPGLQQERTALAWERTAVSAMVAGVLLARFGATESVPIVALFGLAEVLVGALVLVWSGLHYDDLHGLIREHRSLVHPTATRVLGIATIVGSGVALVAAIAT